MNWNIEYSKRAKIRIILKPRIESHSIFVDVVDFRGNVYK